MSEKSYKHWTPKKKKIAKLLFQIGAIKFGEFLLKLHETNPNAPKSPVYIDLRLLRSFPNAMTHTVKLFRDMSKSFDFDCYADIPTAATPIVAILSHMTRIPMITLRQPKTHGAIGTIDGVFETGTVLIIDDLITMAHSKLEAIRTLEASGLKVQDVLVLIDREQGGAEQLGKLGYKLHSAFKFSTLLCWYLDNGIIKQERYEEIMTYLSCPPTLE